MKYQPIITSLLDTDWYKLTMNNVIAQHYPNAAASYKFINRGQHKFPKDFAKHLQDQIDAMSLLRISDAEWEWARINRCSTIVHRGLRLEPFGVAVDQDGSDLGISIIGNWSPYTLWEVPLMATIAELYYKMTNKTVTPGFMQRMDAKAVTWIDAQCYWSDFGTRRRFSHSVQDEVNRIYRHYQPFYVGTSNPYFAMKYNLPVKGTYAHEALMAMQVLADKELAFHEDEWVNHFAKAYGTKNTLILPDTLKLETTLRHSNDLSKFAGFRIDSGDPIQQAKRCIDYLRERVADNLSKHTLLFSDALTELSVILIQSEISRYCPEIALRFGIGTHLTNDVGLTPMNMVIKLDAISVDGNTPFEQVVKISDSPGKESGPADKIAGLKAKFDIV